ncbi:hypothetical protein N7U66_06735 [Lacinutrix neustonica]|uniref:Uncharacterized protein n=1 Tax=Lacinutrix neustonica TaxID=2980107 RepID=A0A9E8SEI8_9FLAO|nr:hypothetical protein [Lacinutrix neustonica]WAC03261.1 hypothetical protein N7U66_06735 [Lacinutrix neustonica]
MKNLVMSAILLLALATTSCKIDQNREAELPEVDVDVDTKAGQLPSYDVDWADVNVGTRTTMVKVPKVVIVMEEEEVEVPYVDVDMPDDMGDKMEQTLMVEAEVTEMEHKMDIKEIRATGSTLYVISELKATDTKIGDKNMRVSDQVTLNAPELDVRYYIVGDKPR